MVAETVVIMAGAARLNWVRVALAAGLGSLPSALVYALTGAVATTWNRGAWAFVLALGIAALMWGLGRFIVPRFHT